ncbi:hypothetical protein [Roseomonas elaeocarpi]|uniref:Uncharacterized protein n=1 Tax=Roseomonas elaeocarpi TaxID=907779 RepID=A0ABV6JT23_9PROT
MAPKATDLYRSSNGDRWSLIQGEPGGRQVVRHEANAASGGQVTDMEVGEFLSIGGAGPEFAALEVILERQAEERAAQD